jgi:hypothetical protein
MSQRVAVVSETLHRLRERCVDYSGTHQRGEDVPVPRWLRLAQPPQQGVSEIQAALDCQLEPSLHRRILYTERLDRGRVCGQLLQEVGTICIQKAQKFALTIG